MSTDESEPTEQTPDEVFLTAVLFECALAALALFLGWAIGPSAREMIPELQAEQLWTIGRGLLFGVVAAIPILLAIEAIRRIPWDPIRQLESLTDDGMIKSLLKLRPAELIVISLCAGIGEELLFRGWLMYWLVDTTQLLIPQLSDSWVLGIALGLSSAVFGLFHPITRLYVFLAAIMGIYFGTLVLYTGNLLVPIAAHATYDAVQLILTARSQKREAEEAGEE